MLEAKDILTRLELPDNIETMEQLGQELEKSWVHRKLATTDPEIKKSLFGEVFSKLNTKAVQNFKEFGITQAEIKDLKFEEVLDMVKSKAEAKLQEAQAASTQGADDRVKTLSEQLEAMKKETAAERKLREDATKALEDERAALSAKERGWMLDQARKNALSKVPIIDDANPATLKGFQVILAEKYQHDLDEQGNLVFKDLSGNPIQNEKKTGFATAEEILLREADEMKLLKKSGGAPQGGYQPPKPPTNPPAAVHTRAPR
jgi:hypothetical protein